MRRGLATTKLPRIDGEWVRAIHTPLDALSNDAVSPVASYDLVQPYLRTIFGFLGVTDTCFHSAGGAVALNYGKVDRGTFLEPHLEAIRAEFQAA